LRGPWRAVLAVTLHLGFVVLPVLIVVGLLGIAAYTYHYDPGGGLRAAAAAVVVATPIGLGIRTLRGKRLRPRGVAVGKKAQPALWRLAEVMASAAGSPVPDSISIVPEPTADLRIDTTLLGLRIRACYLEIGLPLLAGLTVGEIRAVVARELGRMVGRSKVTALCYRIRISIQRTAAEVVTGPASWLFSGYARLFVAVSAPAHREVDLAADAISAEIAGKRLAVTALRKSAAIELGWSDYGREYLSMAAAVGHEPEVLVGFRAFLEQAPRKKNLAERSKRLIADEKATDDHPCMRERLEHMKRLPTSERKPDGRPAFALLRSPKQSVPELEGKLLVSGLGPRMPWGEIARRAGAVRVADRAARLAAAVAQSGLPTEPTIGGVLAAIHHGQATELINAALDPGLAPDDIPQAVVDTLTELLGAAVVDALICAHRAQHELDWSGSELVRLTSGGVLDSDRLVRPAVADPRLVPGLHRALVELGVPLQHARPPADEPEPKLAGLISAVDCAGERHRLLVTDRGLLLLPEHSSPFRRLLGAVFSTARHAELDELSELTASAIGPLREQPGAQWIDNRDIATADLIRRHRDWSLILGLYLDDCSLSEVDAAALRRGQDDTAALRLRSTSDSEERGEPFSGLTTLMGARMRAADELE
jgi:Zn-dependent protease with chaperone function